MNEYTIIVISELATTENIGRRRKSDVLMYQADGLDIYVRRAGSVRRDWRYRSRLDYQAQLICQSRGIRVRTLRCVLPQRKSTDSKRTKDAQSRTLNMFDYISSGGNDNE